MYAHANTHISETITFIGNRWIIDWQEALLAETCWFLLSICKIIDLLLKVLSLAKSMLIGARVAPPSPVGCQEKAGK